MWIILKSEEEIIIFLKPLTSKDERQNLNAQWVSYRQSGVFKWPTVKGLKVHIENKPKWEEDAVTHNIMCGTIQQMWQIW
jgi:hypothetical protein